MHRSGIAVTDAVKKSFNDAQGKEGLFYLKLGIKADAEEFEFLKEGKSVGGDLAAEWKNMANECESKSPCYLFVKAEERWSPVLFVPDLAKVRDKMLYASSIALLKENLGGSNFRDEAYHISDASECSYVEFLKATGTGNKDQVKSWEEKLAEEAENESQMNKSDAMDVGIKGLPIKTDDKVQGAIETVKSGDKCTAIFSLDKKTEVMVTQEVDDLDIKAISAKLPRNEPRFVLHRLDHQHDGADKTAFVFLYYCPDYAVPRMKMFYSTSKSIAIDICEQFGVEITKQVEASEPQEVTPEYIMEELYPKVVQKKVVKKPKPKSKRVFAGKKFSA